MAWNRVKCALIRETRTRFLVHLFHVDKYTKIGQSDFLTKADSTARIGNFAGNQTVWRDPSNKKVPVQRMVIGYVET